MVQVSARRHSIGRCERSPIVRVLPGLMLVMLLGALDQTMMAPALSAVACDLGGLELQAAVAAAYGVAVPPVFGDLAALLGVAFLLALALPARPLRDTAYADDPAPETQPTASRTRPDHDTHQKG